MHHRLKVEADKIKEAERLEEKMQEKPQTAATTGSKLRQNQREIKRPHTTAMNQKPPMGSRPFTGFTNIKSIGVNMAGRAKTANHYSGNPKLRRFEVLIDRLKKILESEKKNLRCIKTLCAKEIDQKN